MMMPKLKGQFSFFFFFFFFPFIPKCQQTRQLQIFMYTQMAVQIHGLIKELTDHLKTPNEKSTWHLKNIQASYMLSTTLTFSFSVIIIGYILLIKLNGRYSYVFSFYTKPIIECKLMRDCNFLTREEIGTGRVSSDLQLYIVSEIFMFYVLEKR